METIDNALIRQIVETAEKTNNNTKQITEIKEELKEMKNDQKAIYDIASSIKVMSAEMINIREDINDVKVSQDNFSKKIKEDIQDVKGGQTELSNKINDIEQKPFRNYNNIKSNIVTGAITAVGTGLLTYIIMYFLNGYAQ